MHPKNHDRHPLGPPGRDPAERAGRNDDLSNAGLARLGGGGLGPFREIPKVSGVHADPLEGCRHERREVQVWFLGGFVSG